MFWRRFLPVLRMGLRALSSRISGRSVLVNLMLSVTDRCNSRCAYCGIPARAKREMKLEEIRKLLDEFAALGGTRVALWGGEPLVREDIGEIIRHCRRRRFLTSMDTNGHLLPERIGGVADLDLCVVSLDGDQKTHDACRGEGSYAKALAGIRVARRRGLPVWTITVLNRKNLGSVDHILDLADREGFFTTWQVLHHQGLASPEAQGLLPAKEHYREVLSRLLSLKRAGRKIVNSGNYFRYLLDWPDFSRSYLEEPRRRLDCTAGRLYANVDTDGLVYPCSVLVGGVPAKNVREAGLAGAVRFVREPPCRACTAGCFIEYNHLYAFRFTSVLNWFRYVVLRGRH